MADFTSVLEVKGAQCRETISKNGSQSSRFARVPFFLSGRTSPANRAYEAVTKVLRVLVRALYLFPILILTKIALFLMGVSAGDYITLAFVVLVVALFALFATVMLFMAVLGPSSERDKKKTLVFAAPAKKDASWIISASVPKADVRVIGRVDAGIEDGAIVLEERWGDNAGTLVRFIEATSFVVHPDPGEPATPIVVELDACPVLLADDDREDTTLAVPGIGAIARLARFVVKQGDRVEVIAREGKPGTHALLQNTANAYRQSESATVVTSESSSPVVIRSISF